MYRFTFCFKRDQLLLDKSWFNMFNKYDEDEHPQKETELLEARQRILDIERGSGTNNMSKWRWFKK